MSSKKSRIHPTYKTKYRVSNWAEYDCSLVRRGDLTLWLSPHAINNWNARPTGRRGGQRKYSDLAIETTLTLRLLFHLLLRQAEGFVRSIFEMMGLHLDAPDHTTLSRRSRHLRVPLRLKTTSGPIDLVIDSSGLAVFGEGEWAAAKHGRRGAQGWRKLHLGVDADGTIVAQCLTDSNVDDATTGMKIIGGLKNKLRSVTADAAYDTRPFYDAAAKRGADVVVPPTKAATVGGRRCPDRKRTIARVNAVGRRRWRKESGYHRQGRVENAFFRYKTIIGDRLRARDASAREVEARVACNILNVMTELGRPASVAIVD
jgi:IS5 family transposase